MSGKRRAPGETPAQIFAEIRKNTEHLLVRFKEGLAKALVRGSEYNNETFESFPVILYWLRQGLALMMGVLWGTLSFTGAPSMIAYFVLSTVAIFVYYTKFLDIDADSYGGRNRLLLEGFQPAMGVFLLSWISTYSFLHKSAPAV